MVVYNMLKKEFEIIPAQSMGYNHLIVFKSYGEMQDFDFARFPNFVWTYCSMQEVNSTMGIQMLCGVRNAAPTHRFGKKDRTLSECVEFFLDHIEKKEKDSI